MGSLGLLPHGTVAIVVIAVLLFAEEAGIPLVVVSGDLILPTGGMLVAAGDVNPWILLPAATAAVLAGALACFAWSAALGSERLRGLARRLHATRHLERTERRMLAGGSVGIAVLRFVPGARVYSTMVVGALGVDLRTYLRGLVPAAVIWVAGFILLGALAGGTVDAILGQVEQCGLLAGAGAAVIATVAVAARRARRRHSTRPQAA